jgi:hypothetical protein
MDEEFKRIGAPGSAWYDDERAHVGRVAGRLDRRLRVRNAGTRANSVSLPLPDAFEDPESRRAVLVGNGSKREEPAGHLPAVRAL